MQKRIDAIHTLSYRSPIDAAAPRQGLKSPRSLTDWEHRGGVCFGIQRDQQIPRPMPALELAVAPHAATRSCEMSPGATPVAAAGKRRLRQGIATERAERQASPPCQITEASKTDDSSVRLKRGASGGIHWRDQQ